MKPIRLPNGDPEARTERWRELDKYPAMNRMRAEMLRQRQFQDALNHRSSKMPEYVP